MTSAHNLQVQLTLAHGLALDRRVDAEEDAIAGAVDCARGLAAALNHSRGDEFHERARRLSVPITQILNVARAHGRSEDLCRVLVSANGTVGDLAPALAASARAGAGAAPGAACASAGAIMVTDWFTQMISDDTRTTNALRLARWAVLAVGIVAAAVVGLAIFAPVAAAGLLDGALAFLRRRR